MSNTNWKVIGTNSGNMSRHRNVKAGKLNYEDGKWKSIYDASGNKKIVHDLSDNVNNQNAVVGIGTSNPFSRLSLGSNPGDGTIGNETTIGQIAAIALHEESNGTNFHGITYITDVSENQDVGGKVNALALHSNTSNENIDLSAAKVYVTDDGVLRIGGKPRTGPAVVDNEYTVYPQVTLDLSGSMQIDGFISFCNLNSAAGQPKDNVANASGTPDIAGTREIPLGAIWVGKKDTATSNVALYIQGAGRKRLELASTAAVAEAAKNGWDISSNPNKFMYNVIEDGGGYVSSNITINSADFSTWNPVHVAAAGVDFGKNFLNALSIRGGSLAVSSSDTLGIMHGGIGGIGVLTKPIQAGFTASQLGLSGEITDVSSGVIFAEKQILIGTGSNITSDLVDNLRPRALLDISGGTSRPIAGIMIGHGIPQGAATSYNIPRATNSIIIGTIGVSKSIGAVDKDVSNSVVMGELNTIDRASTTIVAGNTNKIADSSGSLLLLGFENGNILSTKATNSLIVGWKNNVEDSGQGRSSAGNVIFGKENTYTADVWTDGYNVGINENNAIFGKSNTIKGTEFSFIQGKDNKTYGKELVVFGDSNTVGATTASPAAPQSDHYVQKCLVHGNTNTILGPSGETPLGTASNRLSNVYMMGHENTINIGQENTNAYNITNWTNLTTEETFVLLGSRTEIRDKVGRDNSGVRFAFGTNAMYEDRLPSNADACGNVFTIDNMGSVWIAGNLIVDGSQVILRTEYFDVSDNNITLNSAGHPPNGGGFTILDSAGSGDSHHFVWTGAAGANGEFNTGTADLSTNNMLVLGKLTVNGLIDPTGLVLDTQGSTPAQIASKATLWFDGTDLYFNIGTGSNQKIGTTGGGAGSGMTEWIAAATNGSNQTIDAANTTLTFESSDTAFLTVTTAASRKIQYGVKEGAASTVLTTTAGSALSWGTVTNAMLANSKVTIGTTDVVLGAAGTTTFAGLASVTSTSFTGALTGNADTATKSTNIVGGLVGQLPYQSAADTTVLLAANLTATKKFLTGTGTGSAGQAPAWGVLASGDIPANAANTTGNADTATKITTITNSNIVQLGETQTLTNKTLTAPTLTTPALGIPVSGDFSTGTFTWPTFNQATTANAGSATIANNIAAGAVGDLPYQSAVNTTALLAANTSATKQFLTGTGTGSAGQAPVWAALASGDIPDNAANTSGSAGSATTATTATNIAGGVGTRIPFQSGVDTTTFSANLTFASGTNTLAATNFTGALTGNADTATKSTNITGGLVNQIPFQSAADTTTFDSDLTYTAATDTLSATNFSGALTGNADTATKSTNITGGLANQIPFQSAADTTTFDADLTYDAATDTLAATNFTGALTGNADTVSGLTLASSSSITTVGANAITFTTTGATNVTLPTSGTLATSAPTYAVMTRIRDITAFDGWRKGMVVVPVTGTLTRAWVVIDKNMTEGSNIDAITIQLKANNAADAETVIFANTDTAGTIKDSGAITTNNAVTAGQIVSGTAVSDEGTPTYVDANIAAVITFEITPS